MSPRKIHRFIRPTVHQAKKQESRRFDVLIWLASLTYFLFFTGMSFFLYRHMQYSDFDLAVHAQTLWNLANGSSFSSILGVSFLANHFILIFYPLSYFHQWLGLPFGLLVLQSLALALGGVLTYRLAARQLVRSWAFLVAMAYFFYPPIGYANLFEFHPTTLAVPFLLLAIGAFYSTQYWRFLIWSVLAMSCQENIPLAIIIFSAMSFMEKRPLKWVITPGLMALAWFVTGVLWIQPKLNNGTIEFLSIYSYMGNSWTEILKTLVFKPWVWIGHVLSWSTIQYIFMILFPLLFLPIIGWRSALPIVPLLLQHLLSSREMERLLQYHYTVEMTPFLIAATIGGVAYCLRRWEGKIHHYILLISFLASFLVSGVLMSPYFQSLDRIEKFKTGQNLLFKKSLAQRVPPDAPVVASFQFLPILSQRSELYSFHHVYMGTYTLSEKKYVLPASTQYALVDLNETRTFLFENTQSSKHLKEFFLESPWQVEDHGMDTILLKKGTNNINILYELNPPSEKSPSRVIEANVNGEVELTGIDFQMGSGTHEGHVGLTFYWKCLKKTDRHYGMGLTLVDVYGRTIYEYLRPMVYRLYPTNEWKMGERVVEHYWFIMPPDLPNQAIDLRLGLLDLDQKMLERFSSKHEEKIDKSGRIYIEKFEPY